MGNLGRQICPFTQTSECKNNCIFHNINVNWVIPCKLLQSIDVTDNIQRNMDQLMQTQQ